MEINIFYNSKTKNVYVEPQLARLGEGEQTIIWTLNQNSVWKWNTGTPEAPRQPITFMTPVDAGEGYTTWPADLVPQPLPGNPNAYMVTVNQQGQAQLPNPAYFKWMFHLITLDGSVVYDDDPDIGNDPQGG